MIKSIGCKERLGCAGVGSRVARTLCVPPLLPHSVCLYVCGTGAVCLTDVPVRRELNSATSLSQLPGATTVPPCLVRMPSPQDWEIKITSPPLWEKLHQRNLCPTKRYLLPKRQKPRTLSLRRRVEESSPVARAGLQRAGRLDFSLTVQSSGLQNEQENPLG